MTKELTKFEKEVIRFFKRNEICFMNVVTPKGNMVIGEALQHYTCSAIARMLEKQYKEDDE